MAACVTQSENPKLFLPDSRPLTAAEPEPTVKRPLATCL